jgi:multiple sugar transport system permease protein
MKSPMSMASQKALQSWLLQSGVWVILIFLMGIPFLVNLIYSLSEFRFETLLSPTISGWDNYVRVLKDEEFRDALWFSFRFASVTTCAEVIVGAAIAVYLAPLLQRQQALMAILMLPMMLSPALLGQMYRLMFDDFAGSIPAMLEIIATTLDAPGIAVNPLDIQWVFTSLSLIEILQWMPFVILLVYTAYIATPKDQIEAAQVAGASRWDIFKDIEFPHLTPTLLVLLLIRFIDGFRIFDHVWVLTQGGQGNNATSVSIYLYKAFFRSEAPGVAIAGGIVLVGVVLVLMTLGLQFQQRRQAQ